MNYKKLFIVKSDSALPENNFNHFQVVGIFTTQKRAEACVVANFNINKGNTLVKDPMRHTVYNYTYMTSEETPRLVYHRDIIEEHYLNRQY